MERERSNFADLFRGSIHSRIMEFERWASQGILMPEDNWTKQQHQWNLEQSWRATADQSYHNGMWNSVTPADAAAAERDAYNPFRPNSEEEASRVLFSAAEQDAYNPFRAHSKEASRFPDHRGTSEAAKLAWIRSQIHGRAAEFVTPFGTTRLLTYADHTASGQPLMHVEDVLAKNVLPFYGNTHTEDSQVGKSTTQAVEQAGDFLKRCLGATHNEVLFMCGSGTTGAIKKLQEFMGVIVHHFLRSRVRRMLNPEERWLVIVGPYEHHSNLLSWRESLAELVEIPMDEDGCGLDMGKLKAVLENPKYANRPKLGSFSAASNVTGLITDTRAVARLLHDHGAFACFDFAASGPHVKIDMRPGWVDGYDAVFLSPHKFVGGPGSSGILLMTRKLYLLKNSPPSTCGGGTVNYVNHYPEDTVYIDDIEHREDAGTPAILQKLRAAMALWVKDMVGQEVIESRENYFITAALRRLEKNPYIQILGNTHSERCAILSFLMYAKELDDQGDEVEASPSSSPIWKPRLPEWRDKHRPRAVRRGKSLNSRLVVTLLNDLFGIQARAGCACAGPYGHYLLDVGHEVSLAFRNAIKDGYIVLKPGFARLSFCYYMTHDEFEFILAAMEFLAEHGQRFQRLYDLDWTTGDWTCKRKASSVGAARDLDLGYMSFADKYRTYLDVAQLMASFLDEFPPEERVPKHIDPRLIWWWQGSSCSR